ncbi:hypothetical protein B9N43_15365 [Denitratisoma sp. DHT3]|uniref:glycine zipper 2TM domain-containing protein n=1 Tax=Denitratisoma sp. DHT3 TaxID=1981880 RepID=UPI001198479D|nr:glycine zipper 2TM domain-containing protein [Denitratisoma sp. DHT3]QDX82490.1 hypothetical protein B9N43_15365 [Denitratisoma sp. DHT3]
MENAPRSSLHPLVGIAAAAVILFAGVGTAHFLGWLPGKSEAPPTPAVNAETTPAPTAAPAAPPVAAAPAVAPSPAPAPARKAAPEHKAAPAKPAAQVVATPAAVLPPPPPANAVCQDCGSIESVRQVVKEGEGSGIGAVAGGVLGGALGHGVGQGRGRDLATIAGAVGGAVLGNKIEKSQKSATLWETTVRFEDGTSRVVRNDSPPAWRAGDKVKVVNGAILPR